MTERGFNDLLLDGSDRDHPAVGSSVLKSRLDDAADIDEHFDGVPHPSLDHQVEHYLLLHPAMQELNICLLEDCILLTGRIPGRIAFPFHRHPIS